MAAICFAYFIGWRRWVARYCRGTACAARAVNGPGAVRRIGMVHDAVIDLVH